MQKKETHLEVFKNALTSTVKSISEKKNCEITFGKPTSNINNKNEINLPEIDKLEDIKDYSIFRAMADSEALRLKYSNNDIYNKYKPGGEISQKLYKIAEKIRYEKIGCEVFTGIKKNLFFQYNENSVKLKSNKNKIEESFDSYLKSFFFDIKEPKKTNVNLVQTSLWRARKALV